MAEAEPTVESALWAQLAAIEQDRCRILEELGDAMADAIDALEDARAEIAAWRKYRGQA